MSEIENLLSSTLPQKAIKMQKIDLKKLQIQHEELQSRVSSLRELLTEKESIIKSQRTTLKLQEEKISQLSLNNDTLRHIYLILSRHITENLKEALPILPPLPQDHLANVDNLLSSSPRREKKSKKRIKGGSDTKDPYFTKHSSELSLKKRPNYFDFSGSDLLNAITDLQDIRRAAQQASKNQGRYTIVTSHRISQYEALSLFLSLRNVSFSNNFEIFLPRVLEMLSDLLDIERIILYIYDEGQFYSMAITGEVSKQLIIPKNFSHLFQAIEQGLVITQAYEDSRFDLRYDQMNGFKTNNLACFPLKIADDFIGILECGNKKNEFLKEDIVLLGLVAKHLALGIAGKFYQDSFKAPPTDPGKRDSIFLPSLKSIALSLKSFLLCEKVSIYKITPDKSELKCMVSSENTQNLKLSLNFSFPGLCYTSRKIINIPNAADHSMYNPDLDKKQGITSKEILLIPLADLGVLECINKQKGFTSRDEAKASNMAVIAKNILESNNTLEDLITTCEISDLFTENVFEALLCLNYQGLVIKANALACDMLQIPAASLIGSPISQSFDRAEELLKIAMKSKSTSQSYEKIRVKSKLTNIELICSATFVVLIITILE